MPPAPSWRVGSAHLVASSAPARAARRVSAPLALPRHHRDITLRCPSPRRRPRARRPSAPTPPLPPAPSRRVGSAHLVASSAPARAARRVSAPLALPRHHRDITLRCPSPRRRPRARRPAAPTPPLPPAPSWRVGSAHLVASSAPARAARRVSAPLALPRHHRDITLRCPSPRHSPIARRPSAPTSPLPPAPSWRVGSARPVASSAPALAARRLSAPLALPRHHRDLTLRAQRCPSPCRRPSARRPAAPTSPLPPAPSWRVGAARPVASSAPARAARRVSAPLARSRHHCDITLRTLRCPSLRRRPSARRPSAPTPSLPPAPSWHVDAARFVAGSAPARAARRLIAPLARPRHRRDITLRARALLAAHPRATVQSACRPSAPAPRRRPRRRSASTSLAPARAARRASALLARLRHHRDLTSVLRPLVLSITAPHPETVSIVCVGVVFAARAVVARRRYFPSRELGAGSRRAPSERAACAPLPTQWHHLVV